MLTTYIVNALVAAALGAGTNEIAIVAILRYILPRKKSEMARRIRNIIATDLMSPDKMRDKLEEPQITDLLHKNIEQTINEVLERDLSAPSVLLADHMREMDALTTRLRDSLLDEVTQRFSDPGFSETIIRPFLAERWDTLKHRSPASLLSGRASDLTDFVQQWAASLEHSESLKRNLRLALDKWLAERFEQADSLAAMLPPGLITAIEDLAAAQTPAIVEQLANVLREPAIRDAISTSIMAAINGQVQNQGLWGDLKGILINMMSIENDVRGICRRLPDLLRDNLDKGDNRAYFSAALKDAIRHSFRQPLAADFKHADKRRAFVDMVVDHLWTPGVFSEIGVKVRAVVEEAMRRSIQESFMKLGIGASSDALLDEAAVRCRRIIASDATRELLSGQFDELVGMWKEKPLGRLGRFVGTSARASAAAIIAEEVRSMLRLRLDSFAEEAGVWDIVTSSIENYDNKQISDMVIQLARSELRWVTVLGGVIGVIVGVIQTFMQNLW